MGFTIPDAHSRIPSHDRPRRHRRPRAFLSRGLPGRHRHGLRAAARDGREAAQAQATGSRAHPERQRRASPGSRVTGEFWIAQTFNGLSYGALLFLLASGLSLIFGVMRIVNLAHGSYFMLGGYVGLSVVWRTGSFVAALVAGAVAVGLIGIGMERLFLRRLSGQTLGQVLMTIGFALIFQDLALLIWGGDPYTIPVPALLQGVVRLGLSIFPTYRIFIVLVALVIGMLLWLALERTRSGAMIRAAVDDAEMARGVGINVPVISLAVFALGACLAALGGVIGGAFLGVYPGADFEVLPYAFVVVLVGLLDNYGKALFPELSYFTLFAPMALILALRPTGLFGRV